MSHLSAARRAADVLRRLLFGVRSYPIHHASDEDYQARRVLWNEAAALARMAGLDAPPPLEKAGLSVYDVVHWLDPSIPAGYSRRVIGSHPSVMEAWLAEVEALATAAEALAAREAPAGVAPGSVTPPAEQCRHSQDFRSVIWYGTEYTFTGYQAAVVSQVWQAWQNGTPDLGHLRRELGCA
jgi:hypothetical protein